MSFFQHHLLALAITSITTLGFGLFVFCKNPRGRLHQSMAIYFLSLAWWSGWECAALQMPSRELALLLLRIEYAGVTFIPTLMCTTVSYLLDFSPHTRNRFLIPCYLFSIGALFPGSIFYSNQLFRVSLGSVYYLPFYMLAGPYHWIYLTLWFAAGISGHVAVFLKWRRAEGQDRARLALFLGGTLFAYIGGCPEFALKYGIRLGWLNPFGLYAFPIYVALLTYAVVQHRFLDIRVVIRKSVVYSVLVTLLTVGYFGLVYVAERVSQATFGYQSLWVSLISFALMALAFQPLKIAVQRFVDRLMFHAPQQSVAKRLEAYEARARDGERYRTVATLAAGISHELKNPLAAVQTYLEYLPAKGAEAQFRQQFYEIVGAEVKRLQHIAQGLLDFSKPQAPVLRSMDIRAVLEDVLALVGVELRDKGVTVKTTYTHNGTSVVGDAGQLSQVFLNLILNAREAMGHGGVLTIVTSSANNHVEVQVADTGCGIYPKDLPHIFEPFFSKKTSGTGLGLSIVQQIVEEHGGTVTVESHLGRGTAFTVRLPVQAVSS